jgi:hypothetical protein
MILISMLIAMKISSPAVCGIFFAFVLLMLVTGSHLRIQDGDLHQGLLATVGKAAETKATADKAYADKAVADKETLFFKVTVAAADVAAAKVS